MLQEMKKSNSGVSDGGTESGETNSTVSEGNTESGDSHHSDGDHSGGGTEAGRTTNTGQGQASELHSVATEPRPDERTPLIQNDP